MTRLYVSGENRGCCVWLHSRSRTTTRRPTRRTTAVRTVAFNPNPYEPMERAIGVVNRVISIGEKAQWKQEEGGDPATQSRWVQWQSTTSCSVPVTTEDEQLLRDYLALPTSQYNLLDPRYVESVSEDTFVVRVPLSDIVGVDLTPAISIVATPHRRVGTVTFVGTEATLGSPALDALFKLKVTAVLRGKKASLQSRVNITMALSVPPRLRVIPNPLLGYAGRLITKSVLMATVPNFSNLLVADYGRWGASKGSLRLSGDGDDVVEGENAAVVVDVEVVHEGGEGEEGGEGGEREETDHGHPRH